MEFSDALEGIKKLPGKSKIAVLTAYNYYKTLLKKIKDTPANKILETRIRISNFKKMVLLLKSYCSYKLNLI
jgi:15-cis-phytoene synthase